MRRLLQRTLLLLALPAQASISLQFSDFGQALTGLSDSIGASPVNGLSWGILIDTTGNGFPNPAAPVDVDLTASAGAELAPGRFFFPGGTTVTVPGLDGGSGGVSTANNLDPYIVPEVSAGQAFAIVWFDSGTSTGDPLPPGSSLGVLTHPGLLLPADGTGTSSFAALFAGPDPTRPADLATDVLIPDATVASVVEVDPGGDQPSTRNLAYTFPVTVANDDSGLLSYTLEQSTTLAAMSWTPASTTTEILSDAGGIRTLRIIDPGPVGNEARRFLRLKITTP